MRIDCQLNNAENDQENSVTGQQLARALKILSEKPMSAEKLARAYNIPTATMHGWIAWRDQSRNNMDQIANVIQMCLDHPEIMGRCAAEDIGVVDTEPKAGRKSKIGRKKKQQQIVRTK